MTWDKESRMLTNSLANASYVYNGFDARISKTVGANTTTFKRAGADPVSPVLSDVTGANTTRYLPGISSRVGSTSTFNHSGIKNGILQTNSSQGSTATKRCDAFGNELSTTGTWQTRFDYGGGFGYQTDAESSYKLLGHRYYDPEIGRFLTRDPIKDGRNWYAYCENKPTSGADPTGHAEVVAYWYPVPWAGSSGHHTGIAIIDNMKRTKPIMWSFAGGPERYGYNFLNWGKLIPRSGPWEEGTQDFHELGRQRWKLGVKLVDDQSSWRTWQRRFAIAELDIAIENSSVGYDPLAPPFKLPLMSEVGNSNSFARELLDRTGLRGQYEGARRKRGGSPWAPGWARDPWQGG